MRKITRARFAGFLTLLVLAAGPRSVSAEAAATPATPPTKAEKKAAPAHAETMEIAKGKLERADEDSVRQGLNMLSSVGGDAAAQLVVARLRRGLPPLLTEAAVDALVLLGRPSAAPALLELTQHSRVPIRKRAIDALASLQIRSAQSAVLFALDDPSPDVRMAAVAALGSIGNARVLPALFTAADRHVDGALASIGNIASTRDLPTLLARVQNADVSAIEPALSAMMGRKDMPPLSKLRIVHELDQLASPSARTCLVHWLDAVKTTGPAQLRKALFDAIKRLDELDKAAKKQTVETTGGKS